MPHVHWLQHVPFEELGSIAPWLDQRGYPTTCSRMHAGDVLPPVSAFDWLIVMGGPMNVDDVATYPWLAAEKDLIAQAIKQNKRVLGICLGAQLMARALGAEVTRGGPAEIGWFPVEMTQKGADSPIFEGLSRTFDAFHWHGDSFGIPAGGHHAVRSEACENQAFVYGSRAVGLQFHLETTPASAQALITHCGDELVASPSVQSARRIMADAENFAEVNGMMDKLLANLAAA